MDPVPGTNPRRATARIVGIYFVFGCLWILFSDSALKVLFHDPGFLVRISMFKGLLFVAITAWLLYKLFNRYIQTIVEANRQLRTSETEILHLSSFPKLNPNPVVEIDRTGRLIYANPAAQNIFALTGQCDPQAFLPPDSGSLFSAPENGAGDKIYREIQFNGRMWGVSISSSSEFDTVRLYYADITDLKHVETTLQKSRQRFRSLFDNMTEGVALHSFIRDEAGEATDYRIAEVNPAYQKVLGISGDAIVGKSASEVYGTGRPPYLAEYLSVQCSGRPLNFETYFEPLNKYFAISIIPWGDDGFATIFFDITEQKKVVESGRRSLVFIETMLENAPVGFNVFDGETGACVLANRAIADMIGAGVEESRAQNFRDIESWRTSGLNAVAESVLLDGMTRPMAVEITTSFGKQVALDCSLSRFDVEGRHHLLIVSVDTTGKKRLEEQHRRMEEQMLHVQKLESLGVLAGGIAHDFNNILMVILGNSDLAKMRLSPASPACENIDQIEKAARRAADLARQMLAYSGKGHFVIEVLNVNTVIQEMTHMLEVSISKKVLLRFNLAQDLPNIMVDATQLRQVIMNLVINASEAIGERSGVIAISTGAVDCDRAYLSEMWIDDCLPEGLYIYLEIADTGCGMDKETVSKIFDPFFTTKFTGRGLGMAAVLGIIRGHHGAIKTYSEKGKGTTFKILLPASLSPESRPAALLHDGEHLKGSGTVLLVDDEETIRALGKNMLQFLGYHVLTATDGRESLEIFRQNKDDIVCVILDLTMPHLDGEQTFRELRRIKPEVRVLMSSGYNEQEVTQKFLGKGLAGFIQKPYKVTELGRKLMGVIAPERQPD
jgi:signal transduction histidine kinase/CheY-like chemotaxis protein